MPSIPGLSFSPLTPQGNGSGDGNATPIQQAVRTLSYKVPRTVGAASPIPSQLLNSQGSAGVQAPMGGQMPSNVGPSMGSAPTPDVGLEEILRRLFGMQIPAQEAQGPSMGASMAPAPQFTPGIEDRNAAVGPPIQPPTPVKQERFPEQGGSLGGGLGEGMDVVSNPMKQKGGFGFGR